MMKVTPYPSTLETPSTWITLRSPDSVVSDSLGHENEVDISISSEEKTSATGSNVAPRSMGSEFSPIRKEGTKGSFSLRFTVIGAVCAVHLGVRSVVVDNEDHMVGRGLGQGKDRREREGETLDGTKPAFQPRAKVFLLSLSDFCTFAVFLSWSRASCRVCEEEFARFKTSAQRFTQEVANRWLAHVRETLNPKTPSCSFISLFIRVLFPAPEGPLSTKGLGPDMVLGQKDRQSQQEMIRDQMVRSFLE